MSSRDLSCTRYCLKEPAGVLGWSFGFFRFDWFLAAASRVVLLFRASLRAPCATRAADSTSLRESRKRRSDRHRPLLPSALGSDQDASESAQSPRRGPRDGPQDPAEAQR